MIQKLTKNKYFFDIVLIICILVVALIIFLINMNNKDSNVKAIVYYKDEVIYEIDLSEIDEEKEFDIYLDEVEYITVRVKHNAIRVIYANCKHKDCVRSGWTSSTNKPIICLDLGYKIIIKGNNEVDAVAQ